METAIVFSTAKPHFVIVTPMFNVESYAARNVFATIKATTGIWALDIVLDTCVDETARAVYNMLLNYLVYNNHTSSYSQMCSMLCSDQRSPRLSSVFDPSACTSASILTRIRIITSDATLLGTCATTHSYLKNIWSFCTIQPTLFSFSICTTYIFIWHNSTSDIYNYHYYHYRY